VAYFGNQPADVALKVGSGVITATEIQDASIITADIANDAITANKIDEDGTGFQMGTLGVGASPSFKFDVQDNSTTWASRVLNANAGGQALLVRTDATNDATALGVYANGAYRLLVTETASTFSNKVTIASTGLNAAPSLAIDNSSSSSYIHSIEALGANMTAGQTNIINLGKIGDAKNSGVIGYKWNGAGSTDNLLTFEHWGTGPLMVLDGAGKLGVGTSSISASCNAEFRNTSGYTFRLSKDVQDANSGDNFGSIQFSNNNDATGAIIQGKAAGNWATNNYPTDIIFYTAQTSDVYERFRIKNDGNSVFAGGVHIQANEPTLNFKDLNHSTNSYSMINCNSSSASMEIQADVSNNYDNTAISFHLDAEEVLKMQRANSTSDTESTFGTTSDNNNLRIHGNLRMNAANSSSFQNAAGNETVSLWNGGGSQETVLMCSGGIELRGTTNAQTDSKGRGQINANGSLALNASTTWKTVRTLYGDYQSGILIFHVEDTGNGANTRCQIYAYNADYYERGVNSIDNVTGGVAPGGIEVQIVRDDGSTTSDGGGPYHVQARPANGSSALTVRLLILSAGD